MSKLFTVLTFLLIWSYSKAETKEQILKKLNFKPGHYEVIVPADNATAFCENEELDIDFLTDDKNYTLVIGNNITFAYLEKDKFTDEVKPGCTAEYTNIIQTSKLEQNVKEVCKKPKSAKITKTYLSFSDSTIIMTIEENKNKKTCKYKLINKKGSKS